MWQKNITLVTNVLLDNNFTSQGISLDTVILYSIQADISSASNISGTLILQVSCDVPGAPPSPFPTNWTDITESTYSVITNDSVVWNVENAGYAWVRLQYRHAGSGSAILSARMQIKGR